MRWPISDLPRPRLKGRVRNRYRINADAGIAQLRKSSDRFAWMTDQTVEDAGELVRQVVAGRA